MKRVTALEIVTEVKQLITVDSVKSANALLKSGDWILVNSYNNTAFTIKRPYYVLGRVK